MARYSPGASTCRVFCMIQPASSPCTRPNPTPINTVCPGSPSSRGICHRAKRTEVSSQPGGETRLNVAAKNGLFGQSQRCQKQKRAGSGGGNTVEQRENFSTQENGQNDDGNTDLESRRQQRTVPAGTAHRLAAVNQRDDHQHHAHTRCDQMLGAPFKRGW